jgi:hypothetical protein
VKSESGAPGDLAPHSRTRSSPLKLYKVRDRDMSESFLPESIDEAELEYGDDLNDEQPWPGWGMLAIGAGAIILALIIRWWVRRK